MRRSSRLSAESSRSSFRRAIHRLFTEPFSLDNTAVHLQRPRMTPPEWALSGATARWAPLLGEERPYSTLGLRPPATAGTGSVAGEVLGITPHQHLKEVSRGVVDLTFPQQPAPGRTRARSWLSLLSPVSASASRRGMLARPRIARRLVSGSPQGPSAPRGYSPPWCHVGKPDPEQPPDSNLTRHTQKSRP